MLAAVALAIVAAGALAAISAARSRPPARMLVYAQEWSLWPSRTRLPAGRVTIQLWNRGQDPHDLRIRRLDRHGHLVGSAQGVKVTSSGEISQATWRLKPGRYLLFCSLPQHRKRGMHVRLTVH